MRMRRRRSIKHQRTVGTWGLTMMWESKMSRKARRFEAGGGNSLLDLRNALEGIYEFLRFCVSRASCLSSFCCRFTRYYSA